MYTDTQIEQMRRYDIRELLPAGHEMRGKNELKSGCPLCGQGKDCFSINVPKMYWYCRRCDSGVGAGGTAIDYVMRCDGLPFPSALNVIADVLGIRPLTDRKARLQSAIRQNRQIAQTTRPKIDTDQMVNLTPLLPTIEAANMRLMQPTSERDRAARDYLYMRGITDLEIERFMLGYLPDWVNVGQLSVSPKLIIPRFVDGQLMGVNSKTYRMPKYRYTGKRGVFNGDGIETAENVVIVEGEFDAILLSRFTTAHVITLGGSNHTLSSSEKLSLSFARNIYTLFDGDTAGQNGAAKLTGTLGAKRMQTLPIPAGLDVTDVWQKSGDHAVCELLPADLCVPSTIDCRAVWTGKQTGIGIVQVVMGDGHFMTTRGDLGQCVNL